MCDKTETIKDANATANINASNIVRGITPLRKKANTRLDAAFAVRECADHPRNLYYCLIIIPSAGQLNSRWKKIGQKTVLGKNTFRLGMPPIYVTMSRGKIQNKGRVME